MTLQSFLTFAKKGIRKTWNLDMKKPYEAMEQVFTVDHTEWYEETDTAMGGFGTADEITDGSSIPYEESVKGFDVVYQQRQFGKGFTVTKKLWKFDKTLEIKKLPKRNAYSLRRRVDKDAASIFNTAFSGGLVGGDGKQLAATDHVLTGSSSVNNNRIQLMDAGPTVNPDLDIDALDGVEYQASQMLDEKGEPAPCSISKIVYGPGLVATAEVIRRTQQVTGSNDNDINRWYKQLTPVVMPYITSKTLWAAIDEELNPLVWLWSQDPTLYDPDTEYDTKNVKFNADMFYDFGYSGYQGIFVSKGTNAA